MHLDWFSLRSDLKERCGRPGLQKAICAPDSLCGEGSFYNDCPIEIQSLDSAWGARHGLAPGLLRRVAWPGSGRIFQLPDKAIAVEARSFAREHAWLGGIDFGYDHLSD
jgi:hypothetical protein